MQWRDHQIGWLPLWCAGPEARARELRELQAIYMDRGIDRELARKVALQLTEKDVIRAHARDELGVLPLPCS